MIANHNVDQSRTILGGFSGGACGAYLLALKRPNLFRGAIVQCGHMGSWREFHGNINEGPLFYIFTQWNDFNRPASYELANEIRKKNLSVYLVEGTGGHEEMNLDQRRDALFWMIDNL